VDALRVAVRGCAADGRRRVYYFREAEQQDGHGAGQTEDLVRRRRPPRQDQARRLRVPRPVHCSAEIHAIDTTFARWRARLTRRFAQVHGRGQERREVAGRGSSLQQRRGFRQGPRPRREDQGPADAELIRKVQDDKGRGQPADRRARSSRPDLAGPTADRQAGVARRPKARTTRDLGDL
jgi:hypothetical protein